MESCGKEKETFGELKDDYSVMVFYQKLVHQNS